MCSEGKNKDRSKCNTEPCGCTFTVSTDCVIYEGDDLCAVSTRRGQTLTQLISSIDRQLCELTTDTVLGFLARNIGDGIGLYAGEDSDGFETFKTIGTQGNYLRLVEQEDTVYIENGEYDIRFEGGQLILGVSIGGETTEVSRIDLNTLGVDTFVTRTDFDDSTNILTIGLNQGQELSANLSTLKDNVNVVEGTYDSEQILLTLSDGGRVRIDLTELIQVINSDIGNANVNADYLENNPSSSSYIHNRNPSKTITGSYTVVLNDNNYIIEVDNGTRDISINFGGNLGTSEFFVGFIQKGTGRVTFTNYDIKPSDLTDELFGQGHIAAMEIIAGTKYLTGTLKRDI